MLHSSPPRHSEAILSHMQPRLCIWPCVACPIHGPPACFRPSFLTREKFYIFSKIVIAVLAVLVQYPLNASSSFVLNLHRRLIACLPSLNPDLDRSDPTPIFTPKASSTILLHFILHGTSFLLQIFTPLHQALFALCNLLARLKVYHIIWNVFPNGNLHSSVLVLTFMSSIFLV